MSLDLTRLDELAAQAEEARTRAAATASDEALARSDYLYRARAFNAAAGEAYPALRAELLRLRAENAELRAALAQVRQPV